LQPWRAARRLHRGVTNLVAMTSNAPPDVDPVAVVGSGRQGLQVLVSWLDDPVWFTRTLAAFLG
jgi:hypothetical protein